MNAVLNCLFAQFSSACIYKHLIPGVKNSQHIPAFICQSLPLLCISLSRNESRWQLINFYTNDLEPQEHFQLESKVTLYLNNINILSNFQTDKQINPNCLVDFLKLFTE